MVTGVFYIMHNVYRAFKKILLPAVFVLSVFAVTADAAKFVSTNKRFAVNAADNWTSKRHADRKVVLYVLRGSAYFMVSLAEDNTQDRYLKPMVADQRQEIFQNNYKPSRVKTLPTMSKSILYYFEYRLAPNYLINGYFNYGTQTYHVQSVNVKSAEFAEIFSTLRAPNAPLVSAEQQLQQQIQQQQQQQAAQPDDGRIRANLQPALEIYYESEYKNLVAEHKITGNVVTREALPTPEEEAAEAAKIKAAEEAAEKAKLQISALLKREPLSLSIIVAVLGLWILLSIFVSVAARKASYPSLAGFATDLPPDFFFPFTVTTKTTADGIFSRIVSRTDQTLDSVYSIRMLPFIPAGLSIVIIYETLLAASVKFKFQPDLVLFFNNSVPHGDKLIFAPYIIGALLFLGGILYSGFLSKKELTIMANEQPVLRTQTKHKVVSFIDENNRASSKLVRISSIFSSGSWECQNSDGQTMFHVVDMRPGFYILRRLLGDPLGLGAIRARYAIIFNGKGIGFILNDSINGNRFQIYVDPDHGRDIYPLTALGAILVAKFKEPDRRYPWPF